MLFIELSFNRHNIIFQHDQQIYYPLCNMVSRYCMIMFILSKTETLGGDERAGLYCWSI